MATAKKTTVKKSTTVKKAPVKKAVIAKKAPIVKKAPVSKKISVKGDKKIKSFRVSPNTPTFKTFKITRQTIYWIILVSFIIFVQLWILSLQIQTSNYIEDELSSINDGQ